MNLFCKSSTLILTAGILAVAGCSSHTSSSTMITASAAADVYVTNQTSGSGSQTPQVLGISATGSSGAAVSTVNGPAGDTFIGLASDSSGNLFTVDKAASTGAYTIDEFAAGTNSSGTSLVASSTSKLKPSACSSLKICTPSSHSGYAPASIASHRSRL